MFKKDYDFAISSSSSIERQRYLNRLATDGRVWVEKTSGWMLGGLGPIGHLATRFLGRSRAFASAVGVDPDGDRVVETMQQNGVDCSFIERDPAHPTAKKDILQADASRLILTENGTANYDTIDPARLAGLLSLLGRSRTMLCGNIPFGITRKLALKAPQTQTFLALNPGAKQLNGLSDLPCDLLFINAGDSRIATGNSDAPPEQLFQSLCELSPAARLIQTDGDGPTYLLDRTTSYSGIIESADLSLLMGDTRYLNACGSGDIAACGVILGLMEGMSVADAFANYGRMLATAHLLGMTFTSRVEFEEWCRKTEHCFPPPRSSSISIAA